MDEFLQQVVDNMRKNEFEVVELRTAQEACDYLNEHINAGKTVGVGGSVSVRATGILEKLQEKGCTVYSHWGVPKEEVNPIRRKAIGADVYLCSANAVTRQGKLVLIDGAGNRAAAVCFGPEQVYFVISHSKVVDGGINTAVARIDRNRFDIELPSDGRIEAAHLRRFHPEASAALREALDRAASDSPALAGALDRHRKAVERCADLKCLTGDTRDAYIRAAAGDLDTRCENAVLRTMVPDRAPAREPLPARRATPATGPAAERKRKAGLETEARACIPAKRLEHIARKLSRGGSIDDTDLRGCPTAGRFFRQTPMAHPFIEAASAAGWSIARETTRAGNRDLADDAGERAVRAAALTMWAVAHSFDEQPETPPIEIANKIERTIAR